MMGTLNRWFRRTPLTSSFILSELFLLTAPFVMGFPIVGMLWRLLLLPAYFVIFLVSLVVPWHGHLALALTGLVVVRLIDVVIGAPDES
jgi:hypothetical protein